MSSIKSSGITISELGFFTLFPGFFFYHSAVGAGLIAPVLGGYFSWMAVMLAPFLIARYLFETYKNSDFFSRFDQFYFLYLLYFLLVVGFHTALGADEDVVKNHAVAIMQLTVVFIVFKTANFQSLFVRLALLVTLFVMAAIVLGLSVEGVFYLKQDETLSDIESLASYQAFGRAFFMVAVVCMAFVNHVIVRVLVYAVSVAVLFMNGARSEMIAMVTAILLVEGLFNKHKLAYLFVAAGIAFLYTAYINDVIAMFPNNRTLEILNLSTDTSWQARRELFDYGLGTIADNPFFGAYGSYVSEGGAGAYIHNVLSAWVDLGLFGFAFLLCLILVPMFQVLRLMPTQSKQGRSEEFVLVFTLLVVTVLFLFSAKTFTDIMIAAALGRFSRYKMEIPNKYHHRYQPLNKQVGNISA